MPKLDPFSIMRPKREVHDFSATEGEHTLTLQLRALDPLDYHMSEDLTEQLADQYVGEDKLPFPALGGDEEVKISRSLCTAVAAVYCMQVGEDIYTAEQLIAIAATLPSAWAELGSFVSQLNSRQLKNLPRATEDKTSTEEVSESS